MSTPIDSRLQFIEALRRARAELRDLLGERWPAFDAWLEQAQRMIAAKADADQIDRHIDRLLDIVIGTPAAELVRRLGSDVGMRKGPRRLLKAKRAMRGGSDLKGDKRVSAWIEERRDDPSRPLAVGKPYTLGLRIGDPVSGSLIAGDAAVVPAADLAGGGMQTEWVVTTRGFELSADDPAIAVASDAATDPPIRTARFTLFVPESGDSETKRLRVVPLSREDVRIDILIYAVKGARSELYRQFGIEVPLEPDAVMATEAGVRLRDDLVHAPAAQMNLNPPYEWTTPPGTLNIAVVPGANMAVVKGDLPGKQVDALTSWHGVPAAVAGPIENARAAAERFRDKHSKYLDDIAPDDLCEKLKNPVRIYNWGAIPIQADQAHVDTWETVSRSADLRELAIYGHELYATFFPSGSDLRSWLDSLDPGYRIDIAWTESTGAGWVPNVPWGLMYLPEPPDPGEPVDAQGFFALRFRIGYRGYAGVSAASKALGAVARAHQAYCLYWGSDPKDETGVESAWQRGQYVSWKQGLLVPQIPIGADAKKEVMQMLAQPKLSPTSVIYLFCQASTGDGNKPVLRFGPTSAAADALGTADLLMRKPLVDQPLVFANACTTSAADPYVANILVKGFFDRGCRGFLGTETKVPIRLASRFATIFFGFFYPGAGSAPIAAGEALAQTRLFLLSAYRNIGGIFYTYLNQYELYMAEDAEVKALS